MSRRRAIALCAGVLLSACAPAPVTVDLRFPSLTTFLYAELGRLLVYPLDQASLGDCPRLLTDVGMDAIGEPEWDSESRPVCSFRAGGVQIPGLSPGAHAYVVLIRDDTNTTLLTGCSVGEVYIDAPSVEVNLYPTADYVDATRGDPLAYGSEEEKCGGVAP